MKHKAKKSSEDIIFNEGNNYLPFQKAIKTTDIIFEKIKKTAQPKAELIVFSVDYFTPCSEAIKSICDKNKIRLIESVPYYLKLNLDEGKNVYAADGAHWNEEGHRVAAGVLFGEMVKK